MRFFCIPMICTFLSHLLVAEELAIEAGQSISFPKGKLHEMAELYHEFTDIPVVVSDQHSNKEVMFIIRGPLDKKSAAILLEDSLDLHGWDIVEKAGAPGAKKIVEGKLPTLSSDEQKEAFKAVPQLTKQPDFNALTTNKRLTYPKANGIDMISLYQQYSGCHIIAEPLFYNYEFSLVVTGPLTRAEITKLLRNSIQAGGFVMAPVAQLPNALKIVPQKREMILENLKEQKTRRKTKRARVRYVPKSK